MEQSIVRRLGGSRRSVAGGEARGSLRPRHVLTLLRQEARDRRLLVSAGLLLAAAKLGLRLMPLPTLSRTLAKLPLPLERVSGEGAGNVSGRTLRAVMAAARPLGATCLAQSLALHELLRRRGVRTRLRIGVAKGEGEPLRAHAWVESESGAVIGRLADGERYRVFAPFALTGQAHGGQR